MTEPVFRTTLPIRFDDLDTNGHVQGSVYLAYADHTRWECLVAAGIDLVKLRERGVGPVNLSTNIDFHRELTMPGSVEVTCEFKWGAGKTFVVEQHVHKDDGTLAATVRSVSGLLDLAERRLVADPARHWLALASRPGLLGLSDRGGSERDDGE
ncbi:acyl-CoA thioesterase [Kibdelosporangium phytohabitans]|uniref:Thioesterase n=1 Tax=Kibdelosporangium phytohabitans TaxID=860235 RepID=A0A0N9I2A9_9PSEU|nr:thioesterase family protein [Kibdelosporangium phytohabitans]ALG11781.1 thioesterase [Kibdelosporangium phytohabitans]MBE1463188.1 acyl-CoA thioester hydrolase [Kibdelosporangium phytohabitans]